MSMKSHTGRHDSHCDPHRQLGKDLSRAKPCVQGSAAYIQAELGVTLFKANGDRVCNVLGIGFRETSLRSL